MHIIVKSYYTPEICYQRDLLARGPGIGNPLPNARHVGATQYGDSSRLTITFLSCE